jgi:chemotaxis protein methyltransferase CheR
LYDCLSPGGWLVVGPSETNPDVYSKFKIVRFDDAFVYRKPLEQASFPFPAGPGAGVLNLLLEADPENVFNFQKEELLLKDKAEGTPALIFAPPPEQKRMIQEKQSGWQTQMSAALPDPYQEGLAWMQKKQYAEALRCFLFHLEQHPGDAAAYHQVARLHANGGRLPEAQQWAERALARDPLLAEAHYTLALINHEQGGLEAAISRLKKVLFLQPDFIMAHISLADIYRQSGRSADANRHRTQAIRLASRLAPDAALPGADDLNAGHLLTRA